jgi:hypothetical protein
MVRYHLPPPTTQQRTSGQRDRGFRPRLLLLDRDAGRADDQMQVPVVSGPGPGSVLPASQPIMRAPSEIVWCYSVGFFDGAVQPHLDQMQHASINDPAPTDFKRSAECSRSSPRGRPRLPDGHETAALPPRRQPAGRCAQRGRHRFPWKVGFANNLAAFPASRVC